LDELDEIDQVGNFFLDFSTSEEFQDSDPSFIFFKSAVDFSLQNRIHAVVTAPISKEKWQRAGISYNGHTEYLSKISIKKKVSMFFWSENLKVALFTIHIPLSSIFPYIKRENIVNFIRFIHAELFRLFKKRFTFLISGLNPHAGEEGFIGKEEIDFIIPAIEELKSELSIQGPYPPDTIFLKAKDIKNSVVISWYHDQGLIAFKLLNINSGVNLTLGLPFIRTSPDHGTAYDIAGKGIANPSSMTQAIRLTNQLLDLQN